MNWVKRMWLQAQGVPGDLIWTGMWKNKDLFESCPRKCAICNLEWRPDMEPFIPIFGRVVILVPLDDWYERQEIHELGIKWYNEDFNLVLPTGNASDHVRYACWDHGGEYGKKMVDCLTGEKIFVSPSPKIVWLRDLWRDAKYWAVVPLRFAWLTVRENIPYLLRPIKAIKFFRWYRKEILKL